MKESEMHRRRGFGIILGHAFALIILAFLPMACVINHIYEVGAHFANREKHRTFDEQDSNFKCFWGPWIGEVRDEETEKPIAGAKVKVRVNFQSLLGAETYKWRYAEADNQGRYFVPRVFANFNHFAVHLIGFTLPSISKLIVYEAGYVGYNSIVLETKKYFKLKNNLVLLQKWENRNPASINYQRQMSLIGCGLYRGIGENLREYQAFCREAREDMILECMEEDRDRSRNMCEESVDWGLNREGGYLK